MKIGLSAPGRMGVTVARICQLNNHEIYWASYGRSSKSKERALHFDIKDCGTVDNLAKECCVIFSIVPHDGAVMDYANAIIRCGFDGVFVDANTLHSDVSRMKLLELTSQANFKFLEMAIRGFPIEDVRPEYPEKNKFFIEDGYESVLSSILKHPDWQINIVESGTSKKTVRDLGCS